MPGVGDLAVNSSLLVAGLELSLVKMLRQAMQTADLSGAAAAGSGHQVATSSPHQAAVQTVVRDQRSSASQPAASFEPSSQHHFHPRLADLQPYTCTRPVLPADCKSTIQPPWKVLPWPVQAKPALPPGHRIIKVKADCTDESSVGRMLDLFV